MISSVSARPPPVTSPTIPSFFQLRIFDDPMLRDSPSSIASMTRIEPGWMTFMNASDVMVLCPLADRLVVHLRFAAVGGCVSGRHCNANGSMGELLGVFPQRVNLGIHRARCPAARRRPCRPRRRPHAATRAISRMRWLSFLRVVLVWNEQPDLVRDRRFGRLLRQGRFRQAPRMPRERLWSTRRIEYRANIVSVPPWRVSRNRCSPRLTSL